MGKKRKRASVASFVHHLQPNQDTSAHDADSNKQLNLSAYHPDLDPTLIASPDYTSLLPHCLVHPSQFPPTLIKYWRHRVSLLSLYSSGCLLDQQSWYSITPESVAFRIAKRCATDNTVVDLFAGAGGNAIQFAMTCGKVIAIEIDEVKLRLARWNARVYGVEDRIQFVAGDSMELLENLEEWKKGGEEEGHGKVWNGLTSTDLHHVEAVFLSPPWGGVDYATSRPSPTTTTTTTTTIASHPPPSAPTTDTEYSLSSIKPIHGRQLFHRVSSAFKTPNIAYYLPRNTSLSQLSQLTCLLHNPPLPQAQPAKPLERKQQQEEEEEQVKVEYQYVNYGSKLSSLTAYYGALATEWDDQVDDWKPKPSP